MRKIISVLLLILLLSMLCACEPTNNMAKQLVDEVNEFGDEAENAADQINDALRQFTGETTSDQSVFIVDNEED